MMSLMICRSAAWLAFDSCKIFCPHCLSLTSMHCVVFNICTGCLELALVFISHCLKVGLLNILTAFVPLLKFDKHCKKSKPWHLISLTKVAPCWVVLKQIGPILVVGGVYWLKKSQTAVTIFADYFPILFAWSILLWYCYSMSCGQDGLLVRNIQKEEVLHDHWRPLESIHH